MPKNIWRGKFDTKNDYKPAEAGRKDSFKKSNCNCCLRSLVEFFHHSIQAKSPFAYSKFPLNFIADSLIFPSFFLAFSLNFFGGLPKGGPLIRIPLSLHHARFSLVR